MKTLKQFILLVTLCGGAFEAFADNTTFAYQGRLNAGGSPATGLFDFTFQAFDAPAAGNSVGGTVNVNGVGVTNGLFTALVDLGSSPFTGPARWLEIRVSTNGAGSFTTFAPRQALTPSPYAIYAQTAGTVTNGAITSTHLAANSVAAGNIQNNAVTGGKIASGQVVKSLNGLTDAVSITQGPNITINTVGNSLQISAPAGGLNLPFSGTAASSGSIFTLSNSASGAAAAFLGRVGVGTATPATPVHVRGTSEGLRIDGQTDGGLNQAFISFRHLNGTSSGYVGDGSSEDHIYLAADRGDVALLTSFGRVLTARPNGRVGIGADTPQARLDVRGDIRLGSSGQFHATSGDENLRVIRGTVNFNGTIALGTGFTASRISLGDYLITFSTPFSSAPTVTATVDDMVASLNLIDFYVAGIFSPTTSSVRVRTRLHSDAAGVTTGPDDNKFHFIAIGPR